LAVRVGCVATAEHKKENDENPSCGAEEKSERLVSSLFTGRNDI
jgi:hypothetical protein